MGKNLVAEQVCSGLSVDDKIILIKMFLEEGWEYKDIPQELRDFVLEDIKFSLFLVYNLVEEYNYMLLEIPNELIENIGEDSENIFIYVGLSRFLVVHGYKLSEIPKKIIQRVITSSKYSYWLVESLIRGDKYRYEEIPEELIDKILEDSWYSYHLIEILIRQGYKLSEISQKFMEKVLKDSGSSYFLVQFLIKDWGYKIEDVPKELILKVSESSYYSSELDRILKRFNINMGIRV